MNDERRKAFEAWCVRTERYGSDFETWQAAIDYMESRLDSDDVVEKVARGIAKEGSQSWYEEGDERSQGFQDLAKAALQALKLTTTKGE